MFSVRSISVRIMAIMAEVEEPYKYFKIELLQLNLIYTELL